VKRKRWLVIVMLLMVSPVFSAGCQQADGDSPMDSSRLPIEHNSLSLPEPAYDSETPVEKALLERRSVRSYKEGDLTLKELGQLLWAAQGVTDPTGKRTAPSAGALYPLEIYAVVGKVTGLDPGIYKYRTESHSLIKVADGDQRQALSQVALNQSYVAQGAVDIVITAIYERVTVKYGERGVRYVHMEAGHAAQNVCLEAVALKLGTVTIGAFDDGGVKKVLSSPDEEEPLYIMPVGRTDY
jgi:SagB-type dehydrogenase family enzyme